MVVYYVLGIVFFIAFLSTFLYCVSNTISTYNKIYRDHGCSPDVIMFGRSSGSVEFFCNNNSGDPMMFFDMKEFGHKCDVCGDDEATAKVKDVRLFWFLGILVRTKIDRREYCRNHSS